MFKNQINCKKQFILLLAIIMIFLLAACGATEVPTSEDELPAQAVLEAQSWLADQLNVAIEQVEIVSTEQIEWTDSCLGLGGAAEICAAVITPGWEANFEVNGQPYEVRVDETGTTIRSPQLPAEPTSPEDG
jgi:hypothetical protein